MSLALKLRFLLAKLLIGLAKWVARITRAQAVASLEGASALPREERVRAAQAKYELVPITEKFGLSPGFAHHTVKAVPSEHAYAWPMTLSKGLLRLGLSVSLRSTGRWSSSELGALYWPLSPPLSTKLGDDDVEFARLRLQGPNPSWIRACSSRDELLAHGLRQDAPDWPTARLFVVSYHELLSGIPLAPGRYLAPCIAVFRLDELDLLRPLAIQLCDAVGDKRLYFPDGSASWRLAKLFFNCADMFVHEAVSHFLWTHVYGEKLLLATLRQLADEHPVHRFMAPHFLGTLTANNNSGRRLVGKGGLFDVCFSAGWEGTAELMQRGVRLFDFRKMVLPLQLADRGVEAMPHYAYREDAMDLWGVIEAYARDYVALFYASDAAVLADAELQAWTHELSAEGFPAVSDVPALELMLTAGLFNVVQHTFVNALQYDMFGAPQVFPSSLSVPVPDGQASEQTLIDALPSVEQTLVAITATYGFSIQYNILGSGLAAGHSGAAKAVVERFVRDLAELSKRMKERDAQRQRPYVIGIPQNVSNSINA